MSGSRCTSVGPAGGWARLALLLCVVLVLGACAEGTPDAPPTADPVPSPRPGASATPLVAATAVQAGATPVPIPQAGGQRGPAIVLGTLHMMTPDRGWATGWTASGPRNGGILRSDDAGYHWQNVSPAGVDPASIDATYFLDTDHAWLVSSARPGATAKAVATTITILSTRDGARTWQRGEPLQLSSSGPGWLSFVDAQHGWFMADLSSAAGSMAVAIYGTTDGGLHWDSMSVTAGDPALSTQGSMPLECNKTGISFISPTTGWATGHCNTGGVFFYVTHDAGLTWQAQTLTPPADMPANLFDTCDCETIPPVFASRQSGVAPVKIFTTGHEAVLYVTQDGGRSWTAGKLASNALLRPPDFVSATDGWVTDEARIFRTRDGGLNWTPVARLPDLRLLGTLDFADTQHGWATGGQQVYRTLDGGETWLSFTPVLASASDAGAATPPVP